MVDGKARDEKQLGHVDVDVMGQVVVGRKVSYDHNVRLVFQSGGGLKMILRAVGRGQASTSPADKAGQEANSLSYHQKKGNRETLVALISRVISKGPEERQGR